MAAKKKGVAGIGAVDRQITATRKKLSAAKKKVSDAKKLQKKKRTLASLQSKLKTAARRKK